MGAIWVDLAIYKMVFAQGERERERERESTNHGLNNIRMTVHISGSPSTKKKRWLLVGVCACVVSCDDGIRVIVRKGDILQNHVTHTSSALSKQTHSILIGGSPHTHPSSQPIRSRQLAQLSMRQY